MSKTYKCGFNHCKCEEELTAGNRVVLGSRSYHPQCLKIRNNISEIRDYYIQNISQQVVISQLNKTISTLVFDKNIDTTYLLFALKFAVEHKFKINSPFGLNYIVENTKVKRAWEDKNKIIPKKIKVEIKENFNFESNPIKKERVSFGFAGILKRR